MEEKFKVLVNIDIDQIPKVLELLKNKNNVIFNSTRTVIDSKLKEIITINYNVNFQTCDAFITNNFEDRHLLELRKRGVKIRIIK